METTMDGHDSLTELMTQEICKDPLGALPKAFSYFQSRLRRMVDLRLDRRVRGRVDPSDVLQDAYVDISKRIVEFAARPDVPLFVWLRCMTGQRLARTHRFHLQTRARDAGLDRNTERAAEPASDVVQLAHTLAGSLTTPSSAAARSEQHGLVLQALSSLDSDDREIIALRHFEELSNAEVAATLGLSRSAASNRYVRALARLKRSLIVSKHRDEQC